MKKYLKLAKDSPVRAVFTMDSDCMSPYILPGEALSLVFELPAVGQVAVFQYGGETLVRQYCEDSFGTIYLLAAKRQEGLDRIIPPAEQERLRCLGRVLMEETIPLPLV